MDCSGSGGKHLLKVLLCTNDQDQVAWIGLLLPHVWVAVCVLLKSGPPRPFADRRRPPSLLLSSVVRLRQGHTGFQFETHKRDGVYRTERGPNLILNVRICVFCPLIWVTSVWGGQIKSDSGQLDSPREGRDIKGIDQLFFPPAFPFRPICWC